MGNTNLFTKPQTQFVQCIKKYTIIQKINYNTKTYRNPRLYTSISIKD